MYLRSLRTPLVVLGVVVTAVVALRAADDKKAKDGDAIPPGTIKFVTAPAAVQKTFKDETKNVKIELLGKGTNVDKSNFYKAIVPIGSNDYEMAVAEDGQLLEKLMHPSRTEIALKDCPAVVQKALQEDSKSAKVEAIVRVTAGKRSDYIMEISIQKAVYQVTFTEDGTLMSKMIVDTSGDAQEQAEEPAKVSEKPQKADKKATSKK